MEEWQEALAFALTGLPGPGTIALGLVGVGLAVLLGLRVYNWKLKRSFQAVALVRSIQVPGDGSEIEVEYEFRHRGQRYSGSGRLSLSQLIDGRKSDPVLQFNEELGLPVLYWNDRMYLGEEAIEHVLLQRRPRLRIRFLSADPSRNFPVPDIQPVVAEERSEQV